MHGLVAREARRAMKLEEESESEESSSSEERVLSHGDVVLIRSDLAILQGPHFINDRIIAFYLAHLSSSRPHHHLLLLPPSIPYLLSNLPDQASVAAVAGPLRLASRRLVLLPVNDNPDVCRPEGGSHWTLLVLDNTRAASPRFVHHDTLRGAPNLPVAARLARTLRPMLPLSPPLVEGPAPIQPNGYDCGVYVMALARAICGWWTDTQGRGSGDAYFDAVMREVDAHSAQAMRADLLHLITRLIQDKAKAPNSTSDEGHK